ncbi:MULTISPECIES: hypothetical protein [unclassified Rathayibacter]|uniref:hypothetical protein n=1 Tax=unclassified Rathayibacter TaxID=2609250 RepID=UPI00188C1A0A|nr:MULTISPECIES: hypothetical protein [unclassified Rathayibacter]MBF4463023.1 hypothetical protein [Rathayibacter sp. VKM Ac-2879]MBF4504740.1 hypothetical protein [Rathayibacter sp. VKM Ac-2878]
MKTLLHIGGSLTLDDAIADAVLRYSLALAERFRAEAVTLSDDSAPDSTVVLTLGFGMPLAIIGSSGAPESSEDLLRRIAELEGTLNGVGASDADPRADWDGREDY